MKKIFIILLAFAAMQLNAQNMVHYKQIVKELSSSKYQGPQFVQKHSKTFPTVPLLISLMRYNPLGKFPRSILLVPATN